jgi:hypothetical protein
MRKLMGALICVMIATACLGLANPMAASAADGGAEASFVAQINSVRAQNGVGPLSVHAELVGIARDWTDQMVANGGISHNPSFSSQVTANWTKLGENVGVGYSVESLMAAFVASPGHYKNIVNPSYNYVGVGVSYGADGRMYVTQDFMAADGYEAPAPEPDPAPAAAAPAPRTAAPRAAAPEPAAAPAPEPVPVPVSPPSAAPTRVAAVLAALRVVSA